MAIGRAVANVYATPGGWTPGRVPYDKLVRVRVPGNWFASDSMFAQPETAAAVEWIYAECQRQGLKSVRPNECYRSWDTSAFWKRYWTARGKPGNAANPGQSPHNTGYATDWDYAPNEYAAFAAICRRAGMRFNIDGEPWHSAPLADATVDLTDLGELIPAPEPTTIPKGDTMSISVHYKTDNTWYIYTPYQLRQVPEIHARNLAKAQDGFVLELEGDQIESYKAQVSENIRELQFVQATMPFDISDDGLGGGQTPFWVGIRDLYRKIALGK